MSALRDIPELAGLDARSGMVRIPPEIDVPLTGRVRLLTRGRPRVCGSHSGSSTPVVRSAARMGHGQDQNSLLWPLLKYQAIRKAFHSYRASIPQYDG